MSTSVDGCRYSLPYGESTAKRGLVTFHLLSSPLILSAYRIENSQTRQTVHRILNTHPSSPIYSPIGGNPHLADNLPMTQRHPNIVFPFTIAYLLTVFGIGIWWGTSSITPLPIIFLTIAAVLTILAYTYDKVAEPYGEYPRATESEEATRYATTAAAQPSADYLTRLRQKADSNEIPHRHLPPRQ